MKRQLLIIILALLAPLAMVAQDKLSVAGFSLNENDAEALTEGTKKLDPNGETCAIIKVISTPVLKGLSFESGSLAIVAVEEKTAETWVYVPRGMKKIKISHPQLGSTSYTFPVSVEAGRTYTMRLTGDVVQTLTFNDKKSQELVLNVDPPEAEVIINGMVDNIVNGTLRKTLAFGTHSYTIKAKDYYDARGTFTINDPNAPQEFSVRLKPKFGWLHFGNAFLLDDAKLYVDFNNSTPLQINDTPIRLGSGTHAVRIVKPLYETFEAEVKISDADTTNLSPELVANFGTAVLKAANNDVEILVDNESRGKGTMSLQLGSGKHMVVCRQLYHTDAYQEIDVKQGVTSTFTLPSPAPIYGSLNVYARNAEATFAVDGGKPSRPTMAFSMDKILIGPHTVVVASKGYRSDTISVVVAEGRITSRSVLLQHIAIVTFDVTPKDAQIAIDGGSHSFPVFTRELSSDTTHLVWMGRDGYYPLMGNYKFTRDQEFKRRLTRIMYHNARFYMEAGYQIGALQAMHAAIGFYYKGFNMEFGMKFGKKYKDSFYFTPTESQQGNLLSSTLKPMTYEGKIGWGLVLGHVPVLNRLCVTPQVGFAYTGLHGDKKSSLMTDKHNPVTYVTSGVAAIRLQVAIVRGVSISVMPSYSYAFKKGKLYEQIESLSSDLKGWGTGLNVTAGLNLYF